MDVHYSMLIQNILLNLRALYGYKMLAVATTIGSILSRFSALAENTLLL